MERALKGEAGVVAQAMHHADVGPITLYWGEAGDALRKYKGGSGLSHIIAKHGVEVVEQVVEAISQGRVEFVGQDISRRALIDLGEDRAILSLYRSGKRETWLVTGFVRAHSTDAPFDLSTIDGPIYHRRR